MKIRIISLGALIAAGILFSCTKNRGSSAADIVTDLDGDETTDPHLYWIDDERLFRGKCQNRNSFSRADCRQEERSIVAQPFISAMDAGLEEGVDEREAEITAIYVRIDQILRQMERIVVEGDDTVDPEGLREQIEAAEAEVGDRKVNLHEIDQEIDAVTETLAERPSEDLRLQLVELKDARRQAREAFDNATTALQALRRQFIEANSGIFSARVYDALQRQTEFHEGRRREAQEKLNDQLRQVGAFNTIQEMLHFHGFAYEMIQEQRELFVREKAFVKKFYAEFNKAWEEEQRQQDMANATSELERWCLRDNLSDNQSYTRDLLMTWSGSDRCRDMSQWAVSITTLDFATLLRDRRAPRYLTPFKHFTSLRHISLGPLPSSILAKLPSLTSIAITETDRLNPQDVLEHDSVTGIRAAIDQTIQGQTIDKTKIRQILSKPGLAIIDIFYRSEEAFSLDFIENSRARGLSVSGECNRLTPFRSDTIEFLSVQDCQGLTIDGVIGNDRTVLPDLRYLFTNHIENFSILSQFPKLETLIVGRSLYAPKFWMWNDKLPLEFPDGDALRDRWRSNSPATRFERRSSRGLETLRQLTKLRVFGLRGYGNFSFDHLPAASLEVLGLFNVGVANIQPLTRFAPTLRQLLLTNNELENLSGIEGFPLLQRLNVSGNRLTSAALESLRESPVEELKARRQQPALLRPECPLENGSCEF